MALRQGTVAAFHCRGGALQNLDLLRGPCVPVRQDLRRQTQREILWVKRGSHRLPYLSYLGFPARAARVGRLVFPIDPWQ
jgi:hypothetical protein